MCLTLKLDFEVYRMHGLIDQGKGQALTSVDIKIAMQVIDDEAHLVCLLSHHYAHVTGGTVSALPSPGSAAAPEDVKKSMLKTV